MKLGVRRLSATVVMIAAIFTIMPACSNGKELVEQIILPVQTERADTPEPEDASEENAEQEMPQHQDMPSVEALEEQVDETVKKIFESRTLTQEDMGRITGKSYKPGESLPAQELRLLTLTYLGYDGETQYGEMIVHESVAAEVQDIFNELYEAGFLIEQIKLIDDYDADDELSMKENNTSAYNHRFISGTRTLSNHAKGLAIDINPLYNPYVQGDFISPAEGAPYADRTSPTQTTGMIAKDDVCYKAFTERGWEWGGDWETPKDYQHFEKK